MAIPKVAVLAWRFRRELAQVIKVVGAILLGLLLLLAGFVATVTSALASVPWLTLEQWKVYQEVAETLAPAADPAKRLLAELGLVLDPRHLVAVDAVQLQQDFSQATREHIEELAQRFVQYESLVLTYSGSVYPGRQRTYRIDFPAAPPEAQQHVIAEIISMSGDVRARLTCDDAGCTLTVWGPAPPPPCPPPPPPCEDPEGCPPPEPCPEPEPEPYTVQVQLAIYRLLTLEQVMEALGFTPQERDMARLIAAFDPAWLVSSNCPDGWTPDESRYTWPIHGILTSCFGERSDPFTGEPDYHSGVDIAAATGTPVSAAAGGTVVFAGTSGDYGLVVQVRHATGEGITWYAHLSDIPDEITPGRPVTQGQTIGYVGSTGKSTGPHLHFEWRLSGTPVDPLPRYE